MDALTQELVVDVLDGFDDPSVGAARWNALLHAGATDEVFLTWEWQRAWWESFGSGRLLLLAVREAGDLVTIAPFFVNGGMAFLVGSGGSDYLDVVGRSSEAVLQAVLRALWNAEPDLVGARLYHVRESSPTGAAMRDAAMGLGLRVFDEGDLAAPALDLADAAIATAVVEKKSLVRHERWFRREGELDVEHLRDPEAIAPRLEAFFDQHVRRWAGTPYPSLFLDDAQRGFYRRLVDRVGPTGALRFTVIHWNGEPIAFHFGVLHAGRFLWYKPTFAVDLAKRSPGEVLLRSLLVDAIGEGATVFDFGLGDEPFKQRFATSTPVVRTWGVYPPGES